MHTRLNLFMTLAALAALAAPVARSQETATAGSTAPPWYASVATLRQDMREGTLDAHALTRTFIRRIATHDQSGPTVNAVIEVNPEALELARQADAAREADEPQGLLAGIPVLLKDNIDTGDRMLTSAGSLAMAAAPATRDATVAAKLRAAGAIILGKTNLSEWANFRSTRSSSGWSGRGGLTRNPYVLDRSACGSSSGSGAAVAAGFATVAIGTETDGSIICPAAANGIVGLKPTLGLVSRAGIVPISHSQDTAGPMGRRVADVAAVLTAIAGSDPRDAATAGADEHATDYTDYLDVHALEGKRIGVVRELAGDNPDVLALLDRSIETLRRAGATVVDPVSLPHLGEYGKDEMTVLLHEFKHDLNAYLATRRNLPVHSLAELIEWNKAHADEEMPWFGQELFLAAQATGKDGDEAYAKALERAKRLSGPEGIDAALAAHHLDALLAPAQDPAWVIDLVDGDHEVASAYSPAAVAGYPSITVPAGFVHDLPVGMLFFAGKWSEPTLIGIAFAYEQATRAWRAPAFLPTVRMDEGQATGSE